MPSRPQYALMSSKDKNMVIFVCLTSAITFFDFLIYLYMADYISSAFFPANIDSGICFKRIDVKTGNKLIPAVLDNVVDSELCTRLANSDGVSVSTIEHLMAAFTGCGINNDLLEIDGPEVPILDGSALAFVKEILKTGIKLQQQSLKAVRILKTVKYKQGLAWAKFEPSTNPKMSFSIEFSDAAIGTQSKTLDMSNGSFVRELCDSRTFCRYSEVEAMRSKGFALGGSYEN